MAPMHAALRTHERHSYCRASLSGPVLFQLHDGAVELIEKSSARIAA